MMSAPDKKIILGCFFQHKVIYLCAKFQLYLTPSTGFLPIDITFFGNIGLEYFSNQFLRVFHQSKLELSDLDEKWPKSSPLLLNIFDSSNCVDRHIVNEENYIDKEEKDRGADVYKKMTITLTPGSLRQ